jgi:hypothetical protein
MTAVNDIASPYPVNQTPHFSVKCGSGYSHLNLGRTSRLYTPRLEPIISLSRPLLYERIARNYSAHYVFE